MPIALFNKWRGIVHIWGRGGALECNQEPRKFSFDSDERQAAMLTQENVEKNKTQISQHLRESQGLA